MRSVHALHSRNALESPTVTQTLKLLLYLRIWGGKKKVCPSLYNFYSLNTILNFSLWTWLQRLSLNHLGIFQES